MQLCLQLLNVYRAMVLLDPVLDLGIWHWNFENHLNVQQVEFQIKDDQGYPIFHQLNQDHL